jgi:histidine triad (HIT) family protein
VTVFAATRTVASANEEAPDVDGHSLVHSLGPLVGAVKHAHVHLLPRRDDDAVSVSLARRDLDDERGAALAKRIREAR